MGKKAKKLIVGDNQEIVFRDFKINEEKLKAIAQDLTRLGRELDSYDYQVKYRDDLEYIGPRIHDFAEMTGNIICHHYAGKECHLDFMFTLNLNIYLFTYLYAAPDYIGLKFKGPEIDFRQSCIRDITKAKLKRILTYYIEDFIKLFQVPEETCKIMALTHIGELVILLQVIKYKMDYSKFIKIISQIAEEWKVTPYRVNPDGAWEPVITREGALN